MSAVELAINPNHSIADAAQLFGDDALTRRFAPVFARIAEGAVERACKHDAKAQAREDKADAKLDYKQDKADIKAETK